MQLPKDRVHAARPTVVRLSVFQALGLFITTIGSAGVWFVAAALSRPADLGVLGRVLSTSTLIAGIITAGLGQFLLTMISSVDTITIRRYLWIGIIGGGICSALGAAFVGVAQIHGIDQTIFAMGLLGLGVAVSNIQDAIYLGTGLAQDVPAKAITIILARLVLILSFILLRIDLVSLLIAFTASQLFVGIGWALVRAPRALRKHAMHPPRIAHTSTAWSTLIVSYIYSIGVTSIVTGVPVLVTSLVNTEQAGQFYLAWTFAGILGSLSIAVANSVIAVSLSGKNRTWYLAKILTGLLALLSFGGVCMLLVLPRLLPLFNGHYQNFLEILTPLVIGHIFLGVTLVALAAYRSLAQRYLLISLLVAWPALILGSVAIGLTSSGIAGGGSGFIVGNLIGALAICSISFKTAHSHDQHFYVTALEATR